MRTAPLPEPDASVCRWNGKEKFGNGRTGALEIFSFRVEKALDCSGPQCNASFLNRS
jgi:hypothetical protein